MPTKNTCILLLQSTLQMLVVMHKESIKRQQFSKRVTLYVPRQMLESTPNESVNAIKGTLKTHYLRSLSDEEVEVGIFESDMI